MEVSAGPCGQGGVQHEAPAYLQLEASGSARPCGQCGVQHEARTCAQPKAKEVNGDGEGQHEAKNNVNGDGEVQHEASTYSQPKAKEVYGGGEVQHEASTYLQLKAKEVNGQGEVQHEATVQHEERLAAVPAPPGHGAPLRGAPGAPRRGARGCRAGKSVRMRTALARCCPGPPTVECLTPAAHVVSAVSAVGKAGAALGFSATEVCCMVGGISWWLSSGRDGWWRGPPAGTVAEQESGPPWAHIGSAALRFEPGPSAVGPQAVRRDPAGREAAAAGPQGFGLDLAGQSAAEVIAGTTTPGS